MAKNGTTLPARPQQLELGLLVIGGTLQTKDFWAVVKKLTLADFVKGREGICGDRHFEIIVPDIVIREFASRCICAKEECSVHSLQEESGDSRGRRDRCC